MDETDALAQRFEAQRPHLRAVAYRILGSSSEADDAVQEGWLRLSRGERGDVRNLDAWLTTVVARVCLTMLRRRKARGEEPAPEDLPAPAADAGPEERAVLADSVGVALLVVLDTLAPAERLAFVLHDMFDVPFDEIAPIVDKSPAAARQLASRACRRVRGADAPGGDPGRQREVVAAFLAASQDGDFDRLIALLDPEVVFRADAECVRLGMPAEMRGARTVASNVSGRARGAEAAVVDGEAAWIVMIRGTLRGVFRFTVRGDTISAIDVIAEPDRLAELDVR
jgi:RNA polymerase sigma factor (sigma-70 family)